MNPARSFPGRGHTHRIDFCEPVRAQIKNTRVPGKSGNSPEREAT